ncbi:hypothetical protein PLICRDRAFT_179162 [Plicaturopsis crispa FD-325 SS-3]|uniref:Unplaced genomic scaffold PLICRscaffold_16, whole genome shotgun sequence n=1 Tax=Plicaturopsis crispa FD-325 SS-3 TaxID=944288 RepID=A0A0C9T9A7_PLICR|nr:hypothetical protein PLICRDRAFT_179162 [Plicaturopsis crispa FD-325 SS-3]
MSSASTSTHGASPGQNPATPGQNEVEGSSKQAPVRTKRRYGASCEECRRRKRRCPGRDPQGISLCTFCSESGIQCVYPKPGEVSRIDEVHAEVAELRALLHSLAEANDDARESMLVGWITAEEKSSAKRKSARRKQPAKRARTVDSGSESESLHQVEEVDPVDSLIDPTTAPRLRLSLIETIPREETSAVTAEDAAVRLSSAQVQREVENYVFGQFTYGLDANGPSAEEKIQLLDSYFSWQNPRYEICDRRILETAMHTGDATRFSPFLIWSLYAHSARHLSTLRGREDSYAAMAHFLLAAELTKPSSIPTLQGLLLLATHDAARGRYSQAWYLTGLALAMLTDLGCDLANGVPLDHESSVHLDDEELSIRRRIFWAAFSWDKILSLALSRPPALRSKPHQPSLPDLDLRPSEKWTPVLVDNNCPPTLFTYRPQESYELVCFRESCRVYQFLDDILANIYSKPRQRPLQIRNFVQQIRDRMITWQAQVSPNILLDADCLPSISPPPHVVGFNLLVRLTWILLYRPFFESALDGPSAIPYAAFACQQSAREIGSLFAMYEAVFPLSRLSYILVFAAFCAATIDLSLIRSKEQAEAHALLPRLALASRVLSAGSTNIPGMKESIALLRRHLDITLNQSSPSPSALPKYTAPSPSYTVPSPNYAAPSPSSGRSGVAPPQVPPQRLRVSPGTWRPNTLESPVFSPLESAYVTDSLGYSPAPTTPMPNLAYWPPTPADFALQPDPRAAMPVPGHAPLEQDQSAWPLWGVFWEDSRTGER